MKVYGGGSLGGSLGWPAERSQGLHVIDMGHDVSHMAGIVLLISDRAEEEEKKAE